MFPGPIHQTIQYEISPLPGFKEGISASAAAGDNIGIINYSNTKEKEERKKAVVEVLKYIASEEVQKNSFKKQIIIPGIKTFFYDEEVCKAVQCDLFQNFQFVTMPSYLYKDYSYNNYIDQFKYYMKEFLYNNATAEDTLNNIDNITKLYYITLNTKDSSIGLIIFIVLSIIISVMALSLIFLFINNYNPFFEFLSQEYWILVVAGSIMIICSCYTKYGTLTIFKCHLTILLLSLGFTFSFIPILNKLIINFPEDNNISQWIKKHQYSFTLFFVITDILLNTLLYFEPYTIDINEVEQEKHFQKCNISNKISLCLTILIIMYKIIVVLFMLLLLFIEWNIKNTWYDVRFFISSIYVDILSVIALFILYFININNYIYYYLLRGCLITFVSISNYFLFYGFRIIFGMVHKRNLKIEFINKINNNFINSQSIDNESLKKSNYVTTLNTNATIADNVSNDSKSITSNRTSLIIKIINYHYLANGGDENDNTNSNN